VSLTARVSAFLLVVLAVVLAGFSGGLYLLARSYLYGQVDERLEAALDTLAAVAEIQDDHVEWEPEQRLLALGRDPAEGQVRWTVRNEHGRVETRSANLRPGEFPETGLPPTAAQTGEVLDGAGQRWRVRQRRIVPGSPGKPSGGDPKRRDEQNASHGKERPGAANAPGRHAFLVMTAAASLRGVEGTLSRLAFALAGLSAVLLLLTALLARRLCRRALRPVTHMAQAARAMSAADLGARLPAAGTGDELEDLGRAFNELLGRVEEAFERQRRFTGDASHQLRTPLTGMLGQLEVALRRERPAGEYREALAVAHGQAERLRRIVEALLFLARADAEARQPDLERVDLCAWLADHLRGWDAHPRRPDLRGDLPQGGPHWVRVQSALLGQLLDNLLDNACKYSERGAPVTVRVGEAPGAVTLAVEDAGFGIAPEDLPHVFEPFYRSAQARQLGRAGVGLGLAVAQRIATALGGALSVASEPGKGARFLLRLPADAGADGTAVATPTETSG
jgi:heavy metal sensor kinase